MSNTMHRGVLAPAPAPLPPSWTPLRYHPEQQRLLASDARFKIVAAGRGSGKTFLARRRVVAALAESSGMYFVAGPTHAQTKRVYWEKLKALVPPEWLDGPPRETELCIRTIFGSSLYVTGLDQPARIEGDQWRGGVIDECSDIRPDAWTRSIRPALSQYRGWCWRIGVPKRFGVGAAEHRKAYESAVAHTTPDSDGFWWPSRDILTPEEIAAAQTELGMDDFEEQYNAKWLDNTGALFSGFAAQETVRPCAYDPTAKIWVGADFNVDNMSWVLAHRGAVGLSVFDEVFARNTNTQKTLDILWGRYGAGHTGGWYFTGDASSRARKTSAAVTDYVTIQNDQRFARAGRTVHMPAANPPVKDRIAATNRLLCSAAGVRALHVDARCVKLIEDLKLRCELDTNPDRGHMTDALGYLVWDQFPLRVEGPSGQGRVIILPGPSWGGGESHR